MQALTRFVLRHKLVVAVFWLLIAAAGVMTIGGTTHRMTNSFAMPGQAFKVDNQIAATYGNGGSQTPYVASTGGRRSWPRVRIAAPSAAARTRCRLRHNWRQGIQHPERGYHVRPRLHASGQRIRRAK
jgi:hypothetical protein